MKTCKICGVKKNLFEYYKHNSMTDGRDSRCKECVKEYQRKREEKLRKDPEWLKAERKRHREKYHRLNYKDKHKQPPEKRYKATVKYRNNFPEKYKATVASQRIDSGDLEKHHWSYKKQHRKDVVFIDSTEHAKAHRFMVYDQDHFQYRDDKGNLLDTKGKHIEYLKRKGVEI